LTADESKRILLLLHDGELADVRAIAESAGAHVVECQPESMPADWDVVVTTGRYAKGDHLAGGRERAVRIAVLDRNTRSVRSLARRFGIDLVVRRPVHPTALRLLLLHSLYRGPERRTRRVAVGAPIRFRAGFLRRDGTLADLSMRGCQIVSRHTVRPGQAVVVWIPDPAQPARPFAVAGKIVRTLVAEGGDRGFGVDFGRVKRDVALLLKGAVTAHLEGPAAISGGDPGVTQPIAPFAPASRAPSSEPDPNENSDSGYRVASNGRREVVRAPREFTAGLPAPDGDADERRRASRHAYGGRRVVALGDEAARVLIGRDLSIGGMRVHRAENLAVGKRFQLALHVAPGQTPLVVQAEVVRDDGPAGFAVRFDDVDETAARYLAKMVDSLPVLEGGQGVVISEIVRPAL
jgi:hypothetical protein